MNRLKFSYYSANIYDSFCLGHVSLEQFIDSHKNPTPKTIKQLELINEAALDGNKKLKAKLKEELFAFTPTVFIKKEYARKYDNIHKFLPLMQLDFDGLPDNETAIGLKTAVFNSYDQIVCSYLSPSGLGVKCLMRITVPLDIEHYKAMFKAVETEMGEYGYLDHATTNCILPLFLSADTKILHRDFYDCSVWSLEDRSVVEYVSLNDIPTREYSDKQLQGYYDITVSIFENKIDDIVNGDGHPRLRSACLILGSRVAAGYIDQFEALQRAENMIRSNGYLAKGLNGYIKTSKWAINEGMKTPKYY